MAKARCTIVAGALASLALLAPKTSRAVELGPPGEPGSVELHGFVSPGFIATTSNNYLAKSKKGSFEFTEVGLNITTPLTDKLRTGLQLFARDLGPIGNYAPRVDWFYLDYRHEDWLGIRAGRVQIPFGLYNDTADIDAARVPILLPQSIYSLTGRDFTLAQTGIELYGRVGLGKGGAFEYRHYLGTIYIDPTTQTTIQTQVNSLDVPIVAGQRLLWETPLEGLRGGVSLEAVKLDGDFVYQSSSITENVHATSALASIEYRAHEALIAAEYGRSLVSYRLGGDLSKLPAGTPQQGQATSEHGYVMAAYRFGPHFQPGLYYSLMFPNVDNRSGPAGSQHDVAATLRFDVNSYWLFKVEGHYMDGTAGLSSALNDNVPLPNLERRWGVFLVKTTAHF